MTVIFHKGIHSCLATNTTIKNVSVQHKIFRQMFFSKNGTTFKKIATEINIQTSFRNSRAQIDRRNIHLQNTIFMIFHDRNFHITYHRSNGIHTNHRPTELSCFSIYPINDHPRIVKILHRNDIRLANIPYNWTCRSGLMFRNNRGSRTQLQQVITLARTRIRILQPSISGPHPKAIHRHLATLKVIFFR